MREPMWKSLPMSKVASWVKPHRAPLPLRVSSQILLLSRQIPQCLDFGGIITAFKYSQAPLPKTVEADFLLDHTFFRILHRQGAFDRWIRKEPGCYEPKKHHLRYQVSDLYCSSDFLVCENAHLRKATGDWSDAASTIPPWRRISSRGPSRLSIKREAPWSRLSILVRTRFSLLRKSHLWF